MKDWYISLIVLCTLAACGCSSTASSPPASPSASAQAECDRTGHVWRPALNMCEVQAPSITPSPGRR